MVRVMVRVRVRVRVVSLPHPALVFARSVFVLQSYCPTFPLRMREATFPLSDVPVANK